MKKISDRSKIIYLLLLLVFVGALGLFWMDYIGLINIQKYYHKDSELSMEAKDDEPSLLAQEEFGKEKQKLTERVEEIDQREARLVEREKEFEKELADFEQMKKGLDLEKKKLEDEKKQYSGYQKNVQVLANKIGNMPPDDAVKIIIQWEEPLIIGVLRQMDKDADNSGSVSITPYLISLMPKDKASRIMYLMTQI